MATLRLCGHHCSRGGRECCLCFHSGLGRGQCLICNERQRIHGSKPYKPKTKKKISRHAGFFN